MKNRPNARMAFINAAFIAASVTFGIAACNSQTETTATEEDVVEVQNESAMGSADTSRANDSQFLVEAADINHQEISLGQLAQKQTKNADILAMAKMMVEDHSKALDEVKALADKKSVTLPSGPGTEGQATFDRLKALKNKEFDKAYADEMAAGHEKAIQKFEAASTASKDEDVKSWSTSMLPKLRTHLEHAHQCQKKTM